MSPHHSEVSFKAKKKFDPLTKQLTLRPKLVDDENYVDKLIVVHSGADDQL